jgi:DNA-binding response OmpR family regulator
MVASPALDPTPQAVILVVDDEPALAETLAYSLRREGYHVLVTGDGPTAVRLAYTEHPDLLILDLMLPGMSGFEVCRAVRRDLTLPILILSARDGEGDKVQGLDLGADGYLTKPFSLRELLSRVRALLRRGEPVRPVEVAALPPAAVAPTLLHSGELAIDLAGRVVTRAGAPVPLTPKEFDLLTFLARHPGQVFTREVLLDYVWGRDFFGGTRTVDVHVRWLRMKLEHDAGEPRLIQTIYSVGYKFVPTPAGGAPALTSC